MGRKSKPYFWDEKQAWYCSVNKIRHRLGEHPDGAKKPQKNAKGQWNTPKQIDDAFHALKADPPTVKKRHGKTIDVCLQAFHIWNKANRAPRTASRYWDFIDAFEKRWHGLSVNELDAGHVQTWVDEQEQWNSTTKRNAIIAVQRAFNWAKKNMGLKTNPISGMEKPTALRRTKVVSPADFELLLTHAQDCFGDLLIVSYDCGGRPQELKPLEARHVDLALSRAVLPYDEAKGEIPRAIYFPTERSMAILRRLVKENPEGPLFRNARGRAWTAFAVKCRFERLEKKTGKRFCHYDFRRTYITSKIVAGVDSHVVAQLSGHKSTAMIDKHYSVIGHDPEYMLKMSQITLKTEKKRKAK